MREPVAALPTQSVLITRIEQAVDTLGLTLPASATAQLADYVLLLMKWNKTYNLTAIRDVESMLLRNLFDCMAVVSPIFEQLKKLHNEGLPPTVLDVGSGAGLPGVILAVCLPDVTVSMVDTVGKKTQFVQQAIAALKLKNATVFSRRIEDHAVGASALSEQASIVTARAWTSLGDIAAVAGHCVAQGGCIMAMKGPRLAAEAELLPAAWKLDSVINITVPELSEARCLAKLVRED